MMTVLELQSGIGNGIFLLKVVFYDMSVMFLKIFFMKDRVTEQEGNEAAGN